MQVQYNNSEFDRSRSKKSLREKIGDLKYMTLHQIATKVRLAESMEALVLGNLIYFSSLVIFQITFPAYFITPSIQDFDLSLIMFFQLWVVSLNDAAPISYFLFVFAWMIVGIYVRRKYGRNTFEILIGSLLLPLLFTLIIALLVLVALLPLGIFAIAIILISLVQLVFFGLIFVLLFIIPGVIIANFVKFQYQHRVIVQVEPYYLILNVVPSNEPIRYCPFKMANANGCSYLGYKAPPNRPIICEYQSTFLRCTVYAHIYKEVLKNAN